MCVCGSYHFQNKQLLFPYTVLSDWRPESNVPVKKSVRVFEALAAAILMMRKRWWVYPFPSKPSYFSTKLHSVPVIKLAQVVGAHVLKVTCSNSNRNIGYIH